MSIKRFIGSSTAVLLIFTAGICEAKEGRIEGSTISTANEHHFAVKNDGSLWQWDDYYNRPYEDDLDVPVKIADDVCYVNENLFIKNDGSLWGIGDSDFTYHADTNTFDYYETPVKFMDNVSSVGHGLFHTLIVKKDKSLWVIGDNWSSKDNTYLVYEAPVKLMNNVEKADAGDHHNIILKTDGTVICFGDNSYGKLGEKGYKKHYVFNPIKENIIDVFANENASNALSDDGTLYRWGTYAQESDGNDVAFTPKICTDNVRQMRTEFCYNLVLKEDNTLWVYGSDDNTETIYGYASALETSYRCEAPKKIMDDVYCINSGSANTLTTSLALKENGELYQIDVGLDETGTNTVFEIKKIMDDVRLPERAEIRQTADFEDIEVSDAELYKSVQGLKKAEIVNGVTDTEFMPEKNISRAESAAILLRLIGKGNEIADVRFSDVSKGDWYYGIAGASEKYEILEGYDDNTFRGEETVSELQLAVLAARTLKREGTGIYADRKYKVPDNIPSWADDDIAYALKRGIITEEEASNLSDEHDMTRGEAAVMLYRLYNAI